LTIRSLRGYGLDVQRYGTESLHGEFGRRFRLIDSLKELHETPHAAIPLLFLHHRIA
jgi:hypothetical protein